MKTLKGNLMALAGLALFLTPNLMLAQNASTPIHAHVNTSHESLTSHDRTPRVHDHSLVAHR